MEFHQGRLLDHVHLQVRDVEASKRFYYAAYAFDPDGNNVEAVFHGPTKRSADSAVVTPA